MAAGGAMPSPALVQSAVHAAAEGMPSKAVFDFADHYADADRKPQVDRKAWKSANGRKRAKPSCPLTGGTLRRVPSPTTAKTSHVPQRRRAVVPLMDGAKKFLAKQQLFG